VGALPDFWVPPATGKELFDRHVIERRRPSSGSRHNKNMAPSSVTSSIPFAGNNAVNHFHL